MATILVNQDLCTRCGICAVICPAHLISPADEHTLPRVPDAKGSMCMGCGHCEAYCPSHALLLDLRPDEKEPLPAGAGAIDPAALAYSLKLRRSVRFYTREPVSREKILSILDIARYAASGGNGQPVEWIVVHDPARVQRIARLTVDWMKTLIRSGHPMSGYLPGFISAFEAGDDVICRDAPHLLVATIPEGNPTAETDAIIALTHVDIAAPAFGIGTCFAGFVANAAVSSAPLKEEIGIPPGRKCGYAMLFGHPQYTVHGIPRRKPLAVTWR